MADFPPFHSALGPLVFITEMFAIIIVALVPLASAADISGSSCDTVKQVFRTSGCCGQPGKKTHYKVIPGSETMFRDNICEGKKPTDPIFNNINCTTLQGVVQALEQSATNISTGYQGGMDVGGRKPIMTSFVDAGLCPVNVHWHLGAEHLSQGEFDEHGHGPSDDRVDEVRLGNQCHMYNPTDTRFTTEYNWQYCDNMRVGQTYEIHWPHSKAGACRTPYQYQDPFYDGVFCRDGIISLHPLNTHETIGVQAQVFTVINDENYYYPDLMRGMVIGGEYGADIVTYTGSTTGTSRNNEICSAYTPITWHADRKCHLISASSFDKLCADQSSQFDTFTSNMEPEGARITVPDNLAANNQQHLNKWP